MDMIILQILAWYDWLRALHIIAFIAWMAGLFYLPRLFVYHAQAEIGTVESETFKVMERKLLRIIMNPAMITTWVFGLLMLAAKPDLLEQGWFHVKLLAVVLLSVMHMIYARWRRFFAEDRNHRSHIFYRYMNEVPTILMIIIVIMGVVEPF
jgi:putative membrane protein